MKRDLRQYARQTNARLIAGLLALVGLVGVGLIYIVYGKSAALTGLICLAAGLVPAALVVIILWILERLVRRARGD